jgi:hypothetical protein
MVPTITLLSICFYRDFENLQEHLWSKWLAKPNGLSFMFTGRAAVFFNNTNICLQKRIHQQTQYEMLLISTNALKT